MAGNGAFEGEPVAEGRYSQLLLGDDDEIMNLEANDCFSFQPFYPSGTNSPRILSFGDYGKECKSGVACSDSSSASSTTTSTIITLSKSNKKRNVSRSSEEMQNPEANASVGRQRNCTKKTKSENSTAPAGHAKGKKKEKLGERITALQQLVSPFGKTDTASVLHEALGYIKFLQDQLQVLSSPYLQPSSSTLPVNGETQEGETRKDDLRSRGLCLVPLKLTLHVADSNGADLWSSTAAMLNNISSNS